jgi:FkbM family methyltransferase
MITNETSALTKIIFWNGPQSFEYTPIFEKLIKKCSTFIDIGANIGYYSLIAAKVNPQIQVHAFEPSRAPAQFLLKSVAINKLSDRIHYYPIALSNQSGTLDFFEIRSKTKKDREFNLSGVGTTKIIHKTQENSEVVKVKAETLDYITSQINRESIELIKMDTEGTENLILSGASKTISRYKPIIVCETLFNQIESELEAIMKSHGYQFYNHLNGKLHKTETLIRKEDNGVRDCFFVHPDKTYMIQEFVASK